MQQRRVCPRCGLGIDRKVVVNGKNEIGAMFYCGTTFSNKSNKVVDEGVACVRIQELTTELSRLKAV